MGARMVALRARAQPKAESRAKLLELAFTVSAVALAAKLIELARDDEQGCIARLCAAFALSDTGVAGIERLLRATRQDGCDLDAYTREIAAIFEGDAATRADLVDLLFAVGASQAASAEVLGYLGAVAERLELPPAALERIAARHLDQPPDDPYAVLEIARDAPDDAVRAAWLRLAQAVHPDAMAAHGVPEPIVLATAPRLAAINAAYDDIRAARGMK
jgi:DnaJ like chaperone protein